MTNREINYYYTFNSLTLFWLAESLQWILEISTGDVITADYTIIMSSSLKVTGYHVMYDHSAWFLRVIMSSLRALCCLSSVKKQKHFFFRSMYNKTIMLDSVFVISRIVKVSVRVISLSLRLQLITLTSTFIILHTTKTSSNNCLLSVWRKVWSNVSNYEWQGSKLHSFSPASVLLC